MIAILDTNHVDEFLPVFHNPRNIDRLIVLNHREYHWTSFGPRPQFEDVIDWANLHGIKVEIITNGFSNEQYPGPDLTLERYRSITDIVYWPYWFFVSWIIAMRTNPETNRILLGQDLSLTNKSFDHLYCVLAHNPHNHRCLFYDSLYREKDLWAAGIKSWSMVHHEQYTGPKRGFRFRYWQPQLLEVRNRDSFWLFGCYEIDHSFVEIVLETNPEFYFVTEKTVKSLIFGKLFLVLGCQGFHKKLRELGFELYEEVFDYSFDNSRSISDRVNGILNNLKKIHSLTVEEKWFLFRKVEHKILKNKNTAFNLSTDLTHWPNSVLDLCRKNKLAHTDIQLKYDLIRALSQNSTDI